MASSKETGLSARLLCFHASPGCCCIAYDVFGGTSEGVGGSLRVVLMAVSSVVKLDAVSVAVITFTFGTTGDSGIGLLLNEASSCWLVLVLSKF